IVDVHEKTTTIEVRILCTPRLDSLGNTVGSHGCLQHRWLSKNDGPLTNVGERPRHSLSFATKRENWFSALLLLFDLTCKSPDLSDSPPIDSAASNCSWARELPIQVP